MLGVRFKVRARGGAAERGPDLPPDRGPDQVHPARRVVVQDAHLRAGLRVCTQLLTTQQFQLTWLHALVSLYRCLLSCTHRNTLDTLFKLMLLCFNAVEQACIEDFTFDPTAFHHNGTAPSGYQAFAPFIPRPGTTFPVYGVVSAPNCVLSCKCLNMLFKLMMLCKLMEWCGKQMRQAWPLL